MTASGAVVIKISPAEAEEVARWLRSRPVPLMGLPPSNHPLLPNGVKVGLVEQFDTIARRKRATGRLARVNIEIDRIDASWLGTQCAGGMFASASALAVPPAAKSFFLRCRLAGGAKRGRPTLASRDLADAANRAHIDPRHRKRLRKREREQEAMKEAMKSWGGMLAHGLLGTDEESP